MARPLWKGLISFGLVNVPVELHTAVRSHRPRFRLLHVSDKAPIKYERVCQRDGKSVAWDDLVKGFEYEKGKFVVLTKDDFQAAALEKSATIDILDFVPLQDVDDRFFDTPYYVVPGKGGDRAYAVLRDAIRDSERLGVGKVILREVQHLAALTVVDSMLVLTLMRYADEMVDPEQFKVPSEKESRPKELALARQLIDSLASAWDPAKYTDEYQDKLQKVIRDKLKGKKPEALAAEMPEQTAVVDLMDRLRRSLQGRGRKAGGATSRARRKGARKAA